jgi:hypothetical protein
MLDPIEKNATDISLLNGEFHDYIGRQGLVGPVPFREMATTEFMRTYDFPVNSWPFFVAPAFIAKLEEMNFSIPRLTYKALNAIFAGDPMKMADAMRLDPVMCALFLSGVPFENVCFRSDAVLTEAGLKVLEINSGTSIGGWQLQWMEDLFRQFEGYREFFASHRVTTRNAPVTFFRFLIQSARQIVPSGQMYVLVKALPSRSIAHYGSQLQSYISQAIAESAAACTVGFFTSFDELKIAADGVFHNGRRAHIVTIGEDTAPLSLLRCVLAKKIACPDFPPYLVWADKRNLALLHHAARLRLLCASEARLVEEYVPQTHVLGGSFSTAGIRSEVLANKDRYVVKKCNGMQGIGVYVGHFMTQDAWESAIGGIEQPDMWIAQEYCESRRFYAQSGESREAFNFIWGAFQFGTRYGGCWIRMMPIRGNYDGIINSARGAQESIVFEAPR